MAKRRTKRDTVQNIYNTCKIWNNCPEDVINKVESSTVADKILQYGSGLTYFGTLGIGTGRGTGGRWGYVNLGNRPAGRPVVPVRIPTRPNVPIIETGPVDPVEGNIVNAGGPSIVDLTDATPDINVLPDNEPGIISTGPTEPPSIEITDETPPPRVTVSESTHNNPSFEGDTLPTPTLPSEAVTVTGSVSNTVIGTSSNAPLPIPEVIELNTFSSTAETFDQFSETIIDDARYSTSTPVQRPPPISRPLGARYSLYNRRYTQFRVNNPAFITDPDTLLDQGVFDGNTVTLPSGSQRPAPDPDFQDVFRLSEGYTTRGPNQRVRFSRLGQRTGLTTRSGLQVEPETHYFTSISTIAPGETIELEIIGGSQSSQEVLVGNVSDEWDIISLTESLPSTLSDSQLLDEYESVGENLQLMMGGGRRRSPSVPVWTPRQFIPIGTVTVNYPDSGTTINDSDEYRPIYPEIPQLPFIPPIILEAASLDYYLHPSLRKQKKKKRKKIFLYY